MKATLFDIQRHKEGIRRDKQAVKVFADAVSRSDIAAASKAIVELNDSNQRAALKAIVGLEPTLKFRKWFREKWQDDGEMFRDDSRDDFVLIDALRVLLPPYSGKAVRLFRGEGVFAWETRQHGLSWTTARTIARSFAEDTAKRQMKGGVLISAWAEPQAIVSKVGRRDDGFGESEYIVDRRLIDAVEVLEIFPPTREAILSLPLP